MWNISLCDKLIFICFLTSNSALLYYNQASNPITILWPVFARRAQFPCSKHPPVFFCPLCGVCHGSPFSSWNPLLFLMGLSRPQFWPVLLSIFPWGLFLNTVPGCSAGHAQPATPRYVLLDTLRILRAFELVLNILKWNDVIKKKVGIFLIYEKTRQRWANISDWEALIWAQKWLPP